MRVFLPLLDLVNHAGEGANAAVYKDERGGYSLTAMRDIKCGAACPPPPPPPAVVALACSLLNIIAEALPCLSMNVHGASGRRKGEEVTHTYNWDNERMGAGPAVPAHFCCMLVHVRDLRCW